jgi:malic enzyme
MDPGIRPLTVEDFHRMRARREELKSELMSIQALMNATASQVKQHKLKATVLPAVSKPKSLAAVAPKVASSTVKSPTMLVAISFPKKNATPHRANK